MLDFEHSGRQRIRSVILHNRNGLLKNDFSRIHTFIDKMNCRAGLRLIAGQHGLMDIMSVKALAAVFRNQRRMDIDDPVRGRRPISFGSRTLI